MTQMFSWRELSPTDAGVAIKPQQTDGGARHVLRMDRELVICLEVVVYQVHSLRENRFCNCQLLEQGLPSVSVGRASRHVGGRKRNLSGRLLHYHNWERGGMRSREGGCQIDDIYLPINTAQDYATSEVRRWIVSKHASSSTRC
jgi:hypothetical protein